MSATLVLAAPAFAEPTAADSETALQLYKDGKALRDAGDTPGALLKLRAAHALVQTPITALELGRAHASLGQLLEAREVLLSVARLPVRANESAKATEARAEAESLAAELRPRLGTITIHPKGASAAAQRISVDGVELPAEAAGAPRFLNPGAHVIALDSNGLRSQVEVTLTEGQARDVDIDVPQGPTFAPSAVAPAPLPGGDGAKKRSPLVYVGFGTAIVGVGVGTVTGILTLSKASSLKGACRDGHCPPSSQSDIDATSTTGAISTVAFVIGAAGLALGAIGLYLGRDEPPPVRTGQRAGLRIVPTANGFGGSF